MARKGGPGLGLSGKMEMCDVLHAFAQNTDRPPLDVSIMDRDQFEPDWFIPEPEPDE